MDRPLPPGPPDAVADATPQRLPRVAAAIVLAALAALTFGSTAILDWAGELPVGPVSDPIVMIAGTWDDWMHAIGFTAPADALRALREQIAGG